LEEAARADILLNVLDAADEEIAAQYETTVSALNELGAAGIPMITVLNKVDRLQSADELQSLMSAYPGSIPVSATGGSGLAELCACVEKALSGAALHFRFPPERTDLAALLHRSGQVFSENYADGWIEVHARVDERTAGRLRVYVQSV